MPDEGVHARDGKVGAPAVTREYRNDAITVRWRSELCIHSANCARRLPAVFSPQRHPWIIVDAAAADETADTILRCPSGALTFERHDGGAPEEPEAPTTFVALRHGPLYARGDLEWRTPSGDVLRETRMALCRCGQTGHAPRCDNRCRELGWREP